MHQEFKLLCIGWYTDECTSGFISCEHESKCDKVFLYHVVNRTITCGKVFLYHVVNRTITCGKVFLYHVVNRTIICGKVFSYMW